MVLESTSHFSCTMFLGTWNYNSKHSFLFLTTKIKYLWSLKNQEAKQSLIETTVWQKKQKNIYSFTTQKRSLLSPLT